MERRPNLNRLAHFVATMEAGTITGAAAALGVSKAVVSKQLQLLEEEVGAPLMLRNTRRMQPTEAGRLFYDDARAALTQAHNAYERVQDRGATPKGTLRVTTPVDFGVSFVAPFVAKFQKSYPDVTVDLHLNDDVVDIIEERFDVAFRIGWLTDSSNRARKLMDFEVTAFCSPATADRLGVTTPEDLAPARYVHSAAIPDGTEWVFTKGTDTRTLLPNAVARMNNTLAIRAFVAKGFVYSLLPDFLLVQDFEEGRLVPLLPEWSLRTGGVYTVTPPTHVRSTALERFLGMAHHMIKR